MADEPGTTGGGVPPKPAEAKVQPKKETVRIALPPKPTASPTIKLPNLPATGAAAPAPPSVAAAAPAGAAPPAPATAPGRPPAAAAPVSRLATAAGPKTAAAPAGQKTTAPAAPPRAAAPPKPAATVGVFDKVLAIVAFLISGVALGTVLFLLNLLNKTQGMLDEIPG